MEQFFKLQPCKSKYVMFTAFLNYAPQLSKTVTQGFMLNCNDMSKLAQRIY